MAAIKVQLVLRIPTTDMPSGSAVPPWYECPQCKQHREPASKWLFSTPKAAIEHMFRYHIPFDFIEICVDRGPRYAGDRRTVYAMMMGQ